jgi:hypothetical protein
MRRGHYIPAAQMALVLRGSGADWYNQMLTILTRP